MQVHFATLALAVLSLVDGVRGKTCSLKPLGHGKDDTTQILEAIEICGHHGHTILAPGNYNITR
jgi:galacturan 1,4-alpha-galacturonidase